MRDSSAVEQQTNYHSNQTQTAQIQAASSQNGIYLPIDVSRKMVIGAMMFIALLSFELFNFDTTRYALLSLLGDVRFLGLHWAGILAVAFCAIDFAGLARLFTPQKGHEEPAAVWYLMGAWLLGATMNAVMTWWAISLTLLAHDFGNEILSREQLLQYVPLFVATLVWLTRILFIGAFSVAGEHIFDLAGTQPMGSQQSANQAEMHRARANRPKPTRPVNGRYPRKEERPIPNRSTRRERAPMAARRRK